MTSKNYRPEIDALRAIAVAAVVLYHAGLGPAAGFAGVDVFFVISGYLITWLLLNEQRETGHIDLVAFYARRVRRILPAAAVVIIATVLACRIVFTPSEQVAVYRSAVASSLYFANLFFMQNSGGYFDGPSAEMPLLHLWSLAVEEQFYLIWPLFLILLSKFRARTAQAFLAISMLGSLILAEILIRTYPEMAFYQMPARFWELAAGAFVAFSAKGGNPKVQLAFLGLCMIGIGMTFDTGHFPGLGALPVVAGTAITLWVIHSNGNLGRLGNWLGFGPINFLGRISYSLYLWHWPLLAFYRTQSVDVTLPSCLAFCGAAVVLAALSYRYVEIPFRNLSISVYPKRFLAMGVSVSVSIAIAINALTSVTKVEAPNPNVVALPVQVDAATQAENDHPPYSYRCTIGPIAPANHFPGEGCESAPGIIPKVAILGDSYAATWQPLAWNIAEAMGSSAIDYSRSGCPIFLTRIDSGKPMRDTICHEFNLNIVKRVSGFDTVILATRWDARPLEIDEEGIRSTLEVISPAVRKIYLLGPSPVLRERAPKCIRTSRLDACAITRAEFDRASTPIRVFLRSLASRFKNVEYVELGDFLCTNLECGVMKDGVVLYTDESHVSYTAAKKFAADFTTKRTWRH